MTRSHQVVDAIPVEEQLALRLKALGHPVRLEIVRHLAGCGCCCCGDFCDTLPLAQSTISQHLELLCKAGILALHKSGTRSNYSLNRQALAAIAEHLGTFSNAGSTSPS
ncbi:MAG: metalloregulator ArsR/SmtB family transcription factor [Rhizobiaceae bacterium]